MKTIKQSVAYTAAARAAATPEWKRFYTMMARAAKRAGI